MSRNSNRTGVQQGPGPSTTTNPPLVQNNMVESNPFGISFVVPTETVFLPSLGILYEDSNPLHGAESVEVKSMTAAQEDILMNQDYIQQGTVFDRLIDSIMLTPNVAATDMLECDKMAVLMSARKTGYGDIVTFNTHCEACNSSHDFEASLESILESNKNNSLSFTSSTAEWEYSPDSKTFSFDLPVTKMNVKIKTLTPKDIKILEQSRKQKEKLGLPFNETIEFIRAVIVEAAGVVDPTNLNKLAEVLPSRDARHIKVIHSKTTPKIETKQNVVCPNCGDESEKEVPFSLGWFWSD